jgi:hypothetical protein
MRSDVLARPIEGSVECRGVAVKKKGPHRIISRACCRGGGSKRLVPTANPTGSRRAKESIAFAIAAAR